jgi:hypothetical protein
MTIALKFDRKQKIKKQKQFYMTTQNVTTLFLLTILLLVSCQSSDKQNQNSTTMDKFTWNIQLAGYDFKKYDEKGETSYDNFISEFDKFPWM